MSFDGEVGSSGIKAYLFIIKCGLSMNDIEYKMWFPGNLFLQPKHQTHQYLGKMLVYVGCVIGECYQIVGWDLEHLSYMAVAKIFICTCKTYTYTYIMCMYRRNASGWVLPSQ